MYVSLGTVCSIGAGELAELAAALSSLPCRVVWKVGPDDLPARVSLPGLGLGANVKVAALLHFLPDTLLMLLLHAVRSREVQRCLLHARDHARGGSPAQVLRLTLGKI